MEETNRKRDKNLEDGNEDQLSPPKRVELDRPTDLEASADNILDADERLLKMFGAETARFRNIFDKVLEEEGEFSEVIKKVLEDGLLMKNLQRNIFTKFTDKERGDEERQHFAQVMLHFAKIFGEKLIESTANRQLKFVKLTDNARSPSKSTPDAAGFDLYSAYDYEVPAHDKTVVRTDLQIAVPPNCYGRVAPRSGLAANFFIDVGAGVIDRDYRGNVGVVLFNHSSESFKVNKGDRIAQLICERIEYPESLECESLPETGRGAKGFGSSGTN